MDTDCIPAVGGRVGREARHPRSAEFVTLIPPKGILCIQWLTTRSQVIATKYTGNYRTDQRGKEIIANFAGNGSKSLHASVEASLRKLRTDYIDLVQALP
jgi:hypothetical protein